MIANVLRVIILFGRGVLLARLLPIESFGLYHQSISIVQLTVIVANFGMGGAFLHHAPETENERQTASVHFTLKSIFTLIWATSMLLATLIFTRGEFRFVMLVIICVAAGQQMTQTPALILQRRVTHQRLAVIQIMVAAATTMFSLILAWNGYVLWALLSINILTLLIYVFMLYLWRPIWKPRFLWSPVTVKYYLHFGRRHFPSVMLARSLDQIDDIWTGIFLGHEALGLYSRAYTFATYPRQVLAMPINIVAGGTYAELKGDRHRLSQAFFRVNAVLIRAGFFMGGAFILLAPEFIRLFLGEKWLPMLTTYQLMILFTLFDPIKATIANLFVAVGKPEKITRVRLIQLIVMLIGLFTLGLWLGIIGVALTIDLMLIVGITILLKKARAYVDFSVQELFFVPVLGLLLAFPVAYMSGLIPQIVESDWIVAIVKSTVFLVLYGVVFIVFEHKQIMSLTKMVYKHL